MHGDMEILFSLAGRLHVLLRRETNRIIDVEWMCADPVYAREVIKLARTVETDELLKLADRVEEVHPLFQHVERRTISVPLSTDPKYVNSLR